MARFDFAFFQLLFKIIGHQTGDISRVDYKPQKPDYENVPELQPLPRSTPEAEGVSSKLISDYFKALADDPQANPHHAMVLRHGKVIGECDFAPYEKNMWHITHSMCKSVTGMAIGFLVAEGRLTLDRTLNEIFPEFVGLRGLLQPKITVEELLTMTSHAAFSEGGAISGNEWRRSYMNGGTKGEPGSGFVYNSMNSYMLSAIVTKLTGEPMLEYLKPRLFDKLGITEIFWETCPQGITKGGWGMFLRPEDAAKLGQFYLQRGKWNGEQILPEEWVDTSTKKHVDNGPGNFGYGYQIWVDDRPGSFAFNGMLGQDVIVCPDTDMVLLLNAGNKEMTQEGNLTEIRRGFFGAGYEPSAGPLPENRKEYLELLETQRKLSGEEEYLPVIARGGWGRRRSELRPEVSESDLISFLKGKRYELDKKQVGLFPLVMQVFHNNFTDGISEVGFDEEDRQLIFLLKEGDVWHRLRVGFGRALTAAVDEHGERYITAVTGKISHDEKNRLALILRADFLEEATSRKIKIFFEGEGIEIRWNETPGEDIISDGLKFVNKSPAPLPLPFVKNLMENGFMDIVDTSVTATVHPVTFGTPVKEPVMDAPAEETAALTEPAESAQDSDGTDSDALKKQS